MLTTQTREREAPYSRLPDAAILRVNHHRVEQKDEYEKVRSRTPHHTRQQDILEVPSAIQNSHHENGQTTDPVYYPPRRKPPPGMTAPPPYHA